MDYILYCEDDPDVNKPITKLLQSEFPGFKIISTKSLEEAIKAAAPKVDGLKLAITDGALPDLKMGWDLAEALRGIGYSGDIIYAGSTKVSEDKKDLFCAFVDKGVGFDDRLLEAIRPRLE